MYIASHPINYFVRRERTQYADYEVFQERRMQMLDFKKVYMQSRLISYTHHSITIGKFLFFFMINQIVYFQYV